MATAFDPTRATASDHLLARELADDAGRLLVQLRAELGFGDGTLLRDTGDKSAHHYLLDVLAAARPGDAVLSEEDSSRSDNAQRLAASRVWIIDPLDGTREFGEEGRSDWAVHVALWVDGALAAGAVSMPAAGKTFTASEPSAPVVMTGAPRLVVSRTRPGALAGAWAEAAGAELIAMGSAGAKTMAVVSGAADAYIHSGGQFEWDSAAPVAVAMAAGLHCSRLDGAPLLYNNADPSLPDLVVCHPELADGILAFLAQQL